MEVRRQVTVSAPMEDVWDFLHDPSAVAACVPGAELGKQRDDAAYDGRMSVAFGPKTVVFTGQTEYSFDEEARVCRLDAAGTHGGGRTRASGSVTLSVRGGEADAATTLLDVKAMVRVSGPLSGFVETGGVRVAENVIEEFASRLEADLAATCGPSAQHVTPRSSKPSESTAGPLQPERAMGADGGQGPNREALKGFKLLWLALESTLAAALSRFSRWIRGLRDE